MARTKINKTKIKPKKIKDGVGETVGRGVGLGMLMPFVVGNPLLVPVAIGTAYVGGRVAKHMQEQWRKLSAEEKQRKIKEHNQFMAKNKNRIKHLRQGGMTQAEAILYLHRRKK